VPTAKGMVKSNRIGGVLESYATIRSFVLPGHTTILSNRVYRKAALLRRVIMVP
jgi:hypothetical protein